MNNLKRLINLSVRLELAKEPSQSSVEFIQSINKSQLSNLNFAKRFGV